MARNTDLNAAQTEKNDEFYTQLTDIEKELRHYRRHFRDKIVYCNCDDPTISNFYHYFHQNFRKLGLKQLISTCYKSQNREMFSQHDKDTAIGLRYDGTSLLASDFPLAGDGDFRSQECIDLLKASDIVVTNPPFSLFGEFLAQLIEFDKKFLIIGNMNATTYKAVFPLFQDNRIWYGASIRSGDREFGVPEHYSLTAANSRVDKDGNKFVRVKGVRWFTNLDHRKRRVGFPLYEKYSPEEFPQYDNYDAINVNKTKEIPMDYDGNIGVPTSFMDKYSPDQFEIIGTDSALLSRINDSRGRFYLNGQRIFARIVIRHRRV